MKPTHTLIRLVLMLALWLGHHAAWAQNGERREKIEAMKVAFLTQQLDLSSREAQQFWPVYNEYQDKLEALRQQRRKDRKASTSDALSDKDAEALLDQELAFRQQEIDLQKTYYQRFKGVLTVRKTLKLMRSEEEFKRVLLEQIKGK